MGNYWFAIYFPYYKEKLEMTEFKYNSRQLYKIRLVNNPTWSFVCIASCLYFKYCLGSLGNLSMAFLFAFNGGAYATESGLVTKKEKLPKTSLNLTLFNLHLSCLA